MLKQELEMIEIHLIFWFRAMKKDKDIKLEQYTFLYRDLCSDGGVPQDMRNFVEYLGLSLTVKSISWGVHSKVRPKKNNHYINFYKLVFFVFRYNFGENDRVVFVGGLSVPNAFLASILFFRGIKFDFMPLSQWTRWSLSQKIFTHYPEINSLKSSADGNETAPPCSKKLKAKLVVVFKKLFISLCRPIFRKSQRYWVSSEWEARQVCENLSLRECKFLIYRFGCDLALEVYPSDSYYKPFKGYINIAYWGRIDFYNKGLDRLIEIALRLKMELINKGVKIHILGPDYNNGASLLRGAIATKNLEKVFVVPSNNISKDVGIDGLAWANATILLTRFEVNARVIREANYLQVPILGSCESHITTGGGDLSEFINFVEKDSVDRRFLSFISKLPNLCVIKKFNKDATWCALERSKVLLSDEKHFRYIP